MRRSRTNIIRFAQRKQMREKMEAILRGDRCARCGRELRSSKSKARGMGATCTVHTWEEHVAELPEAIKSIVRAGR